MRKASEELNHFLDQRHRIATSRWTLIREADHCLQASGCNLLSATFWHNLRCRPPYPSSHTTPVPFRRTSRQQPKIQAVTTPPMIYNFSMVFSSTLFLFAFLPAFLAIYFAMPKRTIKNVVLLIFSLLFYAWGEPIYVWLMVFSIAFNWTFGYLISRSRRGGSKKTPSHSRPCSQSRHPLLLQVPRLSCL